MSSLICQALSERLRHNRRVLVPAALAVLVTALLGWLDEGIQALLPNRVYDLRDVGFNALAGLMAIAASLVLAWARRRGGQPDPDEHPLMLCRSEERNGYGQKTTRPSDGSCLR